MKQGKGQSAGGACGVKNEPAKNVRFASVVSQAGQPEVYLPLSDPKHDRAFMRAVKEHRVLSANQEPTSTRKDFGVVGFDESRHNTYLVFEKPLTKFLDARIVGIKYDVVSASPVSASRGARAARDPLSFQSEVANLEIQTRVEDSGRDFTDHRVMSLEHDTRKAA